MPVTGCSMIAWVVIFQIKSRRSPAWAFWIFPTKMTAVIATNRIIEEIANSWMCFCMAFFVCFHPISLIQQTQIPERRAASHTGWSVLNIKVVIIKVDPRMEK